MNLKEMTARVNGLENVVSETAEQAAQSAETVSGYETRMQIIEGMQTVPDNEDIMKTESKELKLADKPYSPADYSGLGRTYLRKNMQNTQFETLLPFNGFVEDVRVEMFSPIMIPDFIYFDTVNKRFVAAQLSLSAPKYYSSWSDSAAVEPKAGMYMVPSGTTGFVHDGKTYVYTAQDGLTENAAASRNVLTQDMISSANTIYHIQYDYDLNGETVEIPEGCVLEFEGGSFKNGTVVGNSTYIFNHTSNPYFENITLQGTFSGIQTVAVTGSYNDLNDKPVIPADLGDLTNDAGYLLPADIEGKVDMQDLATVATTGSYADLQQTPDIPVKVSDLLNDAGYLTEHQDISQKANITDLAAVATSGSYDDLDGKPTIVTDYDDLSNKPDVYLKSEVDSLLNGKANTASVYTKVEVDDAIGTLNTNKASYTDLQTLAATVESKVDTDAVYTKAEIDESNYNKTEVDTLLGNKADTSTVNTALATKADSADVYTKTDVDTLLNDKADGAYVTSAIAEKADIEDIPTRTSQLTNDAHFTTLSAVSDTFYTKTEVNTALGNKADETDLTTLSGKVTDIEGNIRTLNAVNETIGISNIENARISTGWKTVVIADDSNLVWESTNTPSDLDCYIFIKKGLLGNLGLQFNLLINGEKPSKSVDIELHKFYQGSIVPYQHVGWGGINKTSGLFTDLSTYVSTYFRDTYLPWLNGNDYDQVGILIRNTDANDPAFTSGDSLSLTIKTNGNTTTKGYGYELSYNDILKYNNENALTFETSDNSDFKIGVRNDATGEVTYISASAKTSPYSLSQSDYETLQTLLSEGMKTVVIVPVAQEGVMLDTTAMLNIYNSETSNS